jgi:hypothetical protein
MAGYGVPRTNDYAKDTVSQECKSGRQPPSRRTRLPAVVANSQCALGLGRPRPSRACHGSTLAIESTFVAVHGSSSNRSRISVSLRAFTMWSTVGDRGRRRPPRVRAMARRLVSIRTSKTSDVWIRLTFATGSPRASVAARPGRFSGQLRPEAGLAREHSLVGGVGERRRLDHGTDAGQLGEPQGSPRRPGSGRPGGWLCSIRLARRGPCGCATSWDRAATEVPRPCARCGLCPGQPRRRPCARVPPQSSRGVEPRRGRGSRRDADLAGYAVAGSCWTAAM